MRPFKPSMRAIGILLTIACLSSSACKAVEVQQREVADHVCRAGDDTCVPVTPGFIEERIYNLAEIHRLTQALEACEAQHHASLVSFPQDQFKCTVRGSLYVNQGAGNLTDRTDGCQMITMRMVDNALLLRHGGRWVMIPVPKDGGHMQFGYRWGSVVATIGGKEYAISWGYDGDTT